MSEIEELIETEKLVETEVKHTYLEVIQTNFSFFGVFSFLYGLFFTFCLYKNLIGITYPLFVVGTITVLIIFMKKLKVSLKKDSIFYVISAVILGVSTCYTDNYFIHFFNNVGVILLISVFLIHQFYEDKEWKFCRYTSNIISFFCWMLTVCHYPFYHATLFTKSYCVKNNKKLISNDNLKNFIMGIVLTIPLLLIILSLLTSADAIFAGLLTDVFRSMTNSRSSINIIVMIFIGYCFMYMLICNISLRNLSTELEQEMRTKEPLIAITFTSCIMVIYLLFCGIQVVYLFFGGLHNLPEAYTYAEYARQGFFQLLFVCIINFLLVIICLNYFKDSKLLKGILVVISICTYVLIASSSYRMLLYIGEYKMTFLRVIVLWFLGVLALLLSGVLISIFSRKFNLFKFSIVIVAVSYIIFAFSKPDYIIAKYNITNSEYINMEDIFYLMDNLSVDIAPIIENIEYDKIRGYDKEGNCSNKDDQNAQENFKFYFQEIEEEYKGKNLREFNFSQSIAKDIARDYLNKN